MGFFDAILDAIVSNYIVFEVITVFLVLSLIGFYVDKKTRKDADITPIFGTKVSLRKKEKDPNAKKDKKSKGKNSYTTTVVGDQTQAPIAQVPQVDQTQMAQSQTAEQNIYQAPAVDQNQMQGQVNVDPNNQYAMQTQQYQTYAQDQANIYNGQVVQQAAYYDPNTAYNQNEPIQSQVDVTAYQQPVQMVVPAAAQAPIEDTVLPNVAVNPVEAQGQGVAQAAPQMQAIMPQVVEQSAQISASNDMLGDTLDDGAMNMNMVEDDSSPMNFNMSE